MAIANVEGHEPGIYRTVGQLERLELVRRGDVRGELQAAALEEQPWIGEAAAIISICADFARPARDFAEQPPFGRRGSRYVYIEAGAAAQNIQLKAVAEGLGCVLVAGFKDEATAEVLRLASPLAPILHICVGWPKVNLGGG